MRIKKSKRLDSSIGSDPRERVLHAYLDSLAGWAKAGICLRTYEGINLLPDIWEVNQGSRSAL